MNDEAIAICSIHDIDVHIEVEINEDMSPTHTSSTYNKWDAYKEPTMSPRKKYN